MSELKGPKQSKSFMLQFEHWLSENCKEPKPIKTLLGQYQHLTGHSLRKLLEYLDSIESVGNIRLFNNLGKDCCQWASGQKGHISEKRYNVETMEHEYMSEEEPPEEAESLTEYVKKKAREEIKKLGRE